MENLSSRDAIQQIMDSLKSLLLYKNEMYGDSALNPAKVFSKLGAEEGIKIRLDDKLKRVMNSDEVRKNDVADLIGYLVLFLASKGWYNFDEFKD
jgi:hypothetical protein